MGLFNIITARLVGAGNSQISASNPLPVTPVGSSVSNPATINQPFRKGLAVAGTAEQLPSQAFVNGFVIRASELNTGKIFLGASQAGATTVDTKAGVTYSLVPGQAISYGSQNSNAVWLNALNTTDFIEVTGN